MPRPRVSRGGPGCSRGARGEAGGGGAEAGLEYLVAPVPRRYLLTSAVSLELGDGGGFRGG